MPGQERTRSHDRRYRCVRALIQFIDEDGRCCICGRLIRTPGLTREQALLGHQVGKAQEVIDG